MPSNQIDISLELDFRIEIPASVFDFDDHNHLQLGIFKNESLKNSKTASDGLRTLANVGRGLPTLTANYKDVGVFKGMSTAESFASVYEAHHQHRQKAYEAFLLEELYATGDIIIDAWYHAADSQHYRRAGNAIAGVAKRAYAKMSWEHRYLNAQWRREQKGFDLYAIGTGQTLQAIQGRVTNA